MVQFLGEKDNLRKSLLLSELKIMIYIGDHINVVNLVGAVTRLMTSGLLYIVTEFCERGSLDTFLRKHRSANTFFDEILDFYTDDASTSSEQERNGYLQPRRACLKTRYKVLFCILPKYNY